MILNGTYLFPGGVMAAFRDGFSPSEDVVDQSHTLVVGQGVSIIDLVLFLSDRGTLVEVNGQKTYSLPGILS